jgi:hypothetical protein
MQMQKGFLVDEQGRLARWCRLACTHSIANVTGNMAPGMRASLVSALEFMLLAAGPDQLVPIHASKDMTAALS